MKDRHWIVEVADRLSLAATIVGVAWAFAWGLVHLSKGS